MENINFNDTIEDQASQSNDQIIFKILIDAIKWLRDNRLFVANVYNCFLRSPFYLQVPFFAGFMLMIVSVFILIKNHSDIIRDTMPNYRA